MNVLKQIFKMVLGLAVGVLAGLVIAAVFIVGFSDVTLSEFVSKFDSTRLAEVAGAGLVSLAAFAVGLILLVPIHEAGHLVAGLMTGYKFVSFRIFNYTIIRDKGKLCIKKYAIAGTGGQCLLSPPDLSLEDINIVWYNLGGVIANLLVLLLLLPLAFIKGHPYMSVVVWVIIFTDLIIIIFNGIPMKIGGAGNDGYNAIALRGNSLSKRALIDALKSNAMIQSGIRPKDMPDELFVVPEDINYKDQLQVSVPMMAASRLVDRIELSKAREAFETLYTHKDEIIGLYVKEIECELVFLRLIAGDIDGAKTLLTPELRKYILTYSRMMSSKERILCSMALIIDCDRPKANGIYNNLKKRQTAYLLQGEVESDLAIMEYILGQELTPH